MLSYRKHKIFTASIKNKLSHCCSVILVRKKKKKDKGHSKKELRNPESFFNPANILCYRDTGVGWMSIHNKNYVNSAQIRRYIQN